MHSCIPIIPSPAGWFNGPVVERRISSLLAGPITAVLLGGHISLLATSGALPRLLHVAGLHSGSYYFAKMKHGHHRCFVSSCLGAPRKRCAVLTSRLQPPLGSCLRAWTPLPPPHSFLSSCGTRHRPCGLRSSRLSAAAGGGPLGRFMGISWDEVEETFREATGFAAVHPSLFERAPHAISQWTVEVRRVEAGIGALAIAAVGRWSMSPVRWRSTRRTRRASGGLRPPARTHRPPHAPSGRRGAFAWGRRGGVKCIGEGPLSQTRTWCGRSAGRAGSPSFCSVLGVGQAVACTLGRWKTSSGEECIQTDRKIVFGLAARGAARGSDKTVWHVTPLARCVPEVCEGAGLFRSRH